MTPEQWAKAKEIIASALELEPEQRSNFVRESCGADGELYKEIEQIIDAPGPYQLVPGDLVGGRYRIARLLARGGFGETDLANDANLSDRPVVVKVLWRKHAGGADFRREMEALAAIDHPGVVAPLEVGSLPNGDPYLVMQFVDGSTLADVAADATLPLDRVAAILRQTGSALGAVHNRRILHRDLKPTNIMVQPLANREDHVRLIDFGIARMLAGVDATSVRTVPIGSLAYMAPEQFQGRSSKASDIYSMAVIAYELTAGSRPFAVPDDGSPPPRSAPTPPRRLRSSLPPKAEELILKALSVDEAKRPSDAAAYARDLSSALTSTAKPARMRYRWGLVAMVTGVMAITGAVKLSPWAAHKPEHAPAPPSGATVGQPMRIEIALRIRGPMAASRRVSLLRPQLFGNDTFQFEIRPDTAGHLYVLSEPERPNAPLTVLFRSQTSNGFRSDIPGQTTTLIPEQTALAFTRGDSPDRVWIVWSSTANEVLENAGRWARRPYNGVVADDTEVRVIRDSLARWNQPMHVGRNGIELHARTEITAGAIEIEHR